MIIPARFLASKEINGQKVSFFTPPHDEFDFLWVDLEELALAFLVAEKAMRVLQISQQMGTVATAASGPRIATIGCHSMAQGLCGMIDHINGHRDKRNDGFTGPCFSAYVFASAEVEAGYGSLSFESTAKAFRNNGGPFTRKLRDGRSA